jgi:hypothetical protein
LSGKKVILHPSPAPMERKLVGPHLRLVGAATTELAPRSSVVAQKLLSRTAPKETEPLLQFPAGTFGYGVREQAYREVGLSKGHPWCVDTMADAFRAGFPDLKKPRSEREWLRVWEAFVIRYAERRSNRSGD